MRSLCFAVSGKACLHPSELVEVAQGLLKLPLAPLIGGNHWQDKAVSVFDAPPCSADVLRPVTISDYRTLAGLVSLKYLGHAQSGGTVVPDESPHSIFHTTGVFEHAGNHGPSTGSCSSDCAQV